MLAAPSGRAVTRPSRNLANPMDADVRRILPVILMSLAFGTAVSTYAYDDDLGQPLVRMTLVPPAAIDEEVATPRGRYRGFVPLNEIRVDATPPGGRLPEDLSGECFPDETVAIEDTGQLRDWPVAVFEWESSAFYHRPLYFDHAALEVHGVSINRHLQPILSGARFFGTVPLLPAKLLRTPPHVHISTLGQDRPGSSTPCMHQKCAR